MTLGFQESELAVISGRPSVGKTILAMTMAANIAIRDRMTCAFFSLEVAGMVIMQRLLASEACIPTNTIRSDLIKPTDFNSILEAAGRIYEAPLYIIDIPYIKLLDLVIMARRLKAEKDVKIIFIDYLTLIIHENVELPRWEQISDISRSLKALARELRIPIVALSLLKREAEDKPPTLADLGELGSIVQDADLILFLHHDREPDNPKEEQPSMVETDLIIAKQPKGLLDKVKVAFLPDYARFDPIEPS